MVLACGGVVLAAREAPSDDAEARRTGRTAIGLALLAAVGFGSFFAGIDRAEETADVAWVLLAARTADVLLLLAAAASSCARGSRPRRRRSGAIAAIGVFDLLANLLFVLAAGRGLLSVVGVLGSLYPAVTVLLARFVLHERLSRTQRAGVLDHARRRRGARGRLTSVPKPCDSGGFVRLSDCAAGARTRARRRPIDLESSRATTARPRAARAARRRAARPCRGAGLEPGHDLRGAVRAARRRGARADARRDPGVRRHPRARAHLLARLRRERRTPSARRASTAPTTTAYPAGTWDRLDRLVDSIQRARDDDPAHAHRPRADVGDKRKRGHLNDPERAASSAAGSARWPRRYGDRVDLWSIWNEPNHPEFLGPQYKSGAPALAAHLPRALPRRRARDPRRRRAAAATRCCSARPRRSATRTSCRRSRFLRGAMCLDADYEKKRGCAKLRIDGYAHHAYTRKAGPDVRLRRPRRGQHRLARAGWSTALDKAARARRDRLATAAIYLTEFGIQSKPDPIAGVSFTRQAEYLAISERIAYANPRVAAFSQYLMRDDKPRKGSRPSATRASRPACARDKGKKKPAYNGFILPLAATRYGSQRRALGPRAPRDRADRGHDRAQERRAASGSG